MTRCPHQAAGGLRVILRPAETVQKRWGCHQLLAFVMDFPICPSCFPGVSIMKVTGQDLRLALGKAAQRMNNGWLVDWSQTVLELIPFEHPEYMALRQAQAARESQPAPAGATT